MSKGYFITGTDTEVGKTWCTAGIMTKLRQQGHSVVGMKPVASGCREQGGELRNDDALLIQQHGSAVVDYDQINPFRFAPPIAPHIAAALAGKRIKLGTIVERFIQLKRLADQVVVEGVGGWLVPLNDEESVADLAVALQLPVILVVGLRLGCINHALLTAESIRAHGCELAGWIANAIDPAMTEPGATIASISQRIDSPLLATLTHSPALDAEKIASQLSL